jgi:hypothetical protein
MLSNPRMEPTRRWVVTARGSFAALARQVIPDRRRIDENEAEVIRFALERAGVRTLDEATHKGIGELEVIARCSADAPALISTRQSPRSARNRLRTARAQRPCG